MADPYGDEEEQIRAVKDWWKRNGASTLIGAGLAIALVGGWNWWRDYRQEQAVSAAVLYQQLEQAAQGAQESEVKRATAEHLAETLKTEHGGSRYSQYGQLAMVRILVESGKLDAAESILGEVAGAADDEEIKQLANLRLAQVQHARGEAEQALETLTGVPPGAFAPQYAELRGDIFLGMNRPDSAIDAYREALSAAEEEHLAGQGLLRIKLDALAAGGAVNEPGNEVAESIESGGQAQ